MLRSTRLVTISLFIATLCTLAPAAFASPNADFGFDLDFKAKIEAVFSALENVFFGWTDNESSEPAGEFALDSRAEASNSYGTNPEDPDNDISSNGDDAPQEELGPVADPQG